MPAESGRRRHETPPGGGMGEEDRPGSGDPGHQELEALRGRILEVDKLLVELIGERKELVLAIGRAKTALGLPVLDPSREAAVVRRAAELARERGVDEELTRDVIWRIMAAARREQEEAR